MFVEVYAPSVDELICDAKIMENGSDRRMNNSRVTALVTGKYTCPQYLYITGAGFGVGKSTLCAGILAWLLTKGYEPARLAYIKPRNQSNKPVAATSFCERMGITSGEIGASIYRKGFTKDFIDGRTPSSKALRSGLLCEIEELSARKEVVLIDGLGSPASGSVIGVSNADIAAALPCRVIFVGRPGIGAAIDDSLLGVSYLKSKGIRQAWVVYNNVSEVGIDEIRNYVVRRISELMPDVTLLGFIGRDQYLGDQLETADLEQISDWFSQYLNTQLLLEACCGFRSSA
jgi:dethiobiotin synthetase